MFGLVDCPTLQTIRKYFIIGSLISRIYCNWRASIKQPKGKAKEKQRRGAKGGGERQQMEEMTLNKQFSLDDSKTSEKLLKWGSWENYVSAFYVDKVIVQAAVYQCGHSVSQFSIPHFLSHKTSALCTARASAFTVTGLNVDLLTPIISNEI